MTPQFLTVLQRCWSPLKPELNFVTNSFLKSLQVWVYNLERNSVDFHIFRHFVPAVMKYQVQWGMQVGANFSQVRIAILGNHSRSGVKTIPFLALQNIFISNYISLTISNSPSPFNFSKYSIPYLYYIIHCFHCHEYIYIYIYIISLRIFHLFYRLY
jgi:hypothetical protein